MAPGILVHRDGVIATVSLNNPGKLNAICDRVRRACRWHKQFVQWLTPQPAPLTEAEIEENFAYFATEDYRIGMQAFRDRKKPQFKGK